MGIATQNFDRADQENPPSILIMPILSSHIDGLMGLSPMEHAGENYIRHREHFESYIATGLVALETGSKAHPMGRVVGYALLGKNPVFNKSLCLNNIFVHPKEDRKAEYLEKLVRGSARRCMADGQNELNIMVIHEDAYTMALCLKHEAIRTLSNKPGEIPAAIYTISNLPDKFGYAAEKRARELKP